MTYCKETISLGKNWLWLCLVLCEISAENAAKCGFGTSENYASWIADERGGLKFPIYNKGVLVSDSGAESVKGCPYTFSRIFNYENSTDFASEHCRYNNDSTTVTCTGNIDFGFLANLYNEPITKFLVENYNGDTIRENAENLFIAKSRSSASLGEWRGTADIGSTDLDLRLRVTADISFVSGKIATVSGDAFSNKLHLGWGFNGNISISRNSKNSKNMNAIVDVETGDSSWNLHGNLTSTSLTSWNMSGEVKLNNKGQTNLNFHGNVALTSNNTKLSFEGPAYVKNIPIPWTVTGSVSSTKNESATIPGKAFSNITIKDLLFANSDFLADFETNALEGLDSLESITFKNSTLREIPQLDLFLQDLVHLKALYVEDSAITNLKFGDKQSLLNLEFLSFKGSGPVELDNNSFLWLGSSKLKYMNLQDCNIYPLPTEGAVLSPVRQSLRYLDISYTSLTNVAPLTNMLKDLQITHLSAAGLQLKIIPKEALDQVKGTIEFLTLRGNSFKKVPEEIMGDALLNFPEMPKLRELDLRECEINYIERGSFDSLPNLQRLYLSHNNIEKLQDGWSGVPSITYLDLSYNGATSSSAIANLNSKGLDSLSKFKRLEILDLSNGVFTNVDHLIQGLSDKIIGLSLCNTRLKNITDSMLENWSKLEVLDMSNNKNLSFGKPLIETIGRLKSLKYLHLKRCHIRGSFKNVTSLSDQCTLPNLEYIDLSQNDITVLDPEQLKCLSGLKTLDLSGNSMIDWQKSLFHYIPNLENLFIDDNKIDSLNEIMLKDIYQLKTARFGNNPYICGCFVDKIVRELHKVDEDILICPSGVLSKGKQTVGKDYYVARLRQKPGGKMRIERKINKNYETFKTAEYEESNAEILDYSQKSLIDQNFGQCTYLDTGCIQVMDWLDYNYMCSSQGNVMPFKQAKISADCSPNLLDLSWLYISGGVFLALLVITVLIYWKWWHIRLLTKAVKDAAILSLLGRSNYKHMPFQYDVFVSYSDKDRPWVLDHLIPTLEKWDGFKVCLHERDFQVGLSILENIMASIDKSQSIVLVLSQAFIKSQWCQYEMHLAQHRLIETRRDHLILVMLENIPKIRRPKTLQYLMKTKTYIEWPSNPNSKAEVDIFWGRLFKALAKSSTDLHYY